MCAWLQQAANIATLVGLAGLLLGVMAIGFAWKEVRLAVTAAEQAAQDADQAARATQAQLILALDASFAEHRELRNDLNKENWGADTAQQKNQVRRYLALFERIGVLVEEGWLTLDRVDQLYAPRFRKLLLKRGVREVVEGNLNAWRDVVNLWVDLYEKRRPRPDNERFPEPPSERPAEQLGASTSDDTIEPEA
jgi:hypothetical protein